MAMNYSYLLSADAVDRSWVKDAALILGASILVALFAPIAIPLPFTPVPLATQPHVILMLGVLLGSKRATLAALTFLFQGAIGLPVFAGGGGGLWALAGPTGGYLLGYVAAAYVTGKWMESGSQRSLGRIFCAMALGNLTIYVFGLAWLGHFIGFSHVFMAGMAPFLIGDGLKLIAATRGLKALLRM